jgi:glycosyltransferase involved in cell wall biosynthesis
MLDRTTQEDARTLAGDLQERAAPPLGRRAGSFAEKGRVAFVQDGSRRGYAVPVALAKAGLLEHMYTEWFSAPSSLQGSVARLTRFIRPQLGQRMTERHHPDLPAKLVRSNPRLLLWQEWSRRRFGDAETFDHWRARTVTRWILRRGFEPANVLHCFIRNVDPALVQAARASGLVTIGDQYIAPAAVERAERERQLERWSLWEPRASVSAAAQTELWEQQTWPQLDHIVCGASYVRDGLRQAGVPDAKITVLPHPAHLGDPPAARQRDPGAPVTVGFIGGSVDLRKGAPYFVEVAGRFPRREVRFVMVGPVRLSAQGVNEAREVVQLVGQVPRSAVAAWLARFDVFFFPSTCEGSANAVMEAMVAGLPVVTSPNSGSVVRDGQEGYIVPYDDVDQAEVRLAAMVRDPTLRQSLGEAARRRAAEFSLDWYSAELAALIGRLHSASAAWGRPAI